MNCKTLTLATMLTSMGTEQSTEDDIANVHLRACKEKRTHILVCKDCVLQNFFYFFFISLLSFQQFLCHLLPISQDSLHFLMFLFFSHLLYLDLFFNISDTNLYLGPFHLISSLTLYKTPFMTLMQLMCILVTV